MHDATFLDESDCPQPIHATTEEALDVVLRANVKTLVLYHLSIRSDRAAAIPALRAQVAASGFIRACWLLDEDELPRNNKYEITNNKSTNNKSTSPFVIRYSLFVIIQILSSRTRKDEERLAELASLGSRQESSSCSTGSSATSSLMSSRSALSTPPASRRRRKASIVLPIATTCRPTLTSAEPLANAPDRARSRAVQSAAGDR